MLENKLKEFTNAENENTILKEKERELTSEIKSLNKENADLREMIEFTELEKQFELEELKQSVEVKVVKKSSLAGRFAKWCRRHLIYI